MRRATHRFRVFLLIIAAIAVLAILAGVAVKGLFVVRSVVVEGVEDVDEQQIIRAANLEFGSSIFAVDAQKVRQSLEATGVYAVDGVLVRKPSTVILQVRARTRDAVTLNGGKYLVMDSEGYVVESLSALPEDGIVYVYGLNATAYRVGGRVTAAENRLEAMQAVLDAIRGQGAMGLVSDFNVEDVNNLTLTTRTGLRVELGDASDMQSKILWMKSAATDLESRGDVRGTLDVSSGTKADYIPQ